MPRRRRLCVQLLRRVQCANGVSTNTYTRRVLVYIEGSPNKFISGPIPVAEAIVRNVNGHVPSEGVEAHLMMRGVLVDATGLHASRIHPQSIDAVLDRLPRLGIKKKLGPVFRGEAERHPQCRGYFAETYLCFGLLIRTAPWKE
jgi:hypothetical protein